MIGKSFTEKHNGFAILLRVNQLNYRATNANPSAEIAGYTVIYFLDFQYSGLRLKCITALIVIISFETS